MSREEDDDLHRQALARIKQDAISTREREIARNKAKARSDKALARSREKEARENEEYLRKLLHPPIKRYPGAHVGSDGQLMSSTGTAISTAPPLTLHQNSPLLQLPAEIRFMIWRHVLSDRVLHVKYQGRDRLTGHGTFLSCVCVAARSENEVYEEFKEGFKDTPRDEFPEHYKNTIQKRHHGCICNKDKPKPRKPRVSKKAKINEKPKISKRRKQQDLNPVADQPEPQPNSSILRVCRQIYQDANRLLVSTNTLSFDNPYNFKSFINHLNPLQVKLLAKVHLDLCGRDSLSNENMEGSWADVLGLDALRRLPGWQTLHVNIKRAFGDVSRPSGQEVEKLGIMRRLSELSMLPLKNVTVIVDEVILEEELVANNSHSSAGLPLQKNRSYAEQIRSMLFDPNCREVFRAERRAVQERYAEEQNKAYKALCARAYG